MRGIFVLKIKKYQGHMKFIASDGKKYETDCFSTEDLLRVVQSIPSPKKVLG